jgi:hypothetical protein
MAIATQRLDLAARYAERRDQYQSRRKSFNALVMGDYGTGKTKSLATLPGPLALFQFDPGGANSLEPEIQNGAPIYIFDYSADDPASPKAFRQFEKDLREMKKDGYLDEFKAVALDSLTTFADVLMSTILHANGRAPREGNLNLNHKAGQVVAVPEIRDYQVQMVTMADFLGFFCGIQPHFICNAHITLEKDEVSGRMYSFPLVTGKLKQQIPLLFDEVYVARATSKSGGMEYRFLTEPKGIHRARTRLGVGGKLAAAEEQNYTTILTKCGFHDANNT